MMKQHTTIARNALGLFATVALTLGLALSPNQANSQVYFAEDINPSPDQGSPPRGPRTNSDNARNNFVNSAPNFGVQNFEGYAPFQQANFTLTNVGFPLTSITGTLSVASTSTNCGIYDEPNPTGTNGGVYPSSGRRYLGYFPGSQQGGSASVLFSNPVLGVGFYITDVELYQPVVTLYYTNNTTQDFTIPATTYTFDTRVSGNILFWGYRTTNLPINKFAISFSTNGDFIGIDDITILVPEPASMLALSAGLAGLVGLRRRRKA